MRSFATLRMTRGGPGGPQSGKTSSPEPVPGAVAAAHQHDLLALLAAAVARRAGHRDPRLVIPARRTAFGVAGQLELCLPRQLRAIQRVDDKRGARRLERAT